MKLDVLADLDHLFMINFSVEATRLWALLPGHLRLLTREGRAFPSIVLPAIRNLRQRSIGFPKVDYDLFGLRILVEYESSQLGLTKGIYFSRLIMDPNHVRRVANVLTAFDFERGTITRQTTGENSTDITVALPSGKKLFHANVHTSGEFPSALTEGSCFESADEALAMYNDIAYGFLPSADARSMHILQIADPHPNYEAWPLRHLEVNRDSIIIPTELADAEIQLEPCYYVGQLPRYWRWLKTERVPEFSQVDMEPYFDVWNILHDGHIVAAKGDCPGDLSLKIQIGYLCEVLSKGSSFLWVHLHGVRVASFFSHYNSGPMTDPREWAAEKIEVIGAGKVRDHLLVDCDKGELNLVYADATYELENGTPISFHELEEACEKYWYEWERNNKENS